MEYTLRKIRENAIINDYFDIIKNMRNRLPYISTDAVVNELMKKQAPRFFITYDNARRVVSMMARGVNICFSNANKREMYHEIYRRYLQMKEETGIAGFCILEQILEQPAPSYYINVATMKGIIYKSINKR